MTEWKVEFHERFKREITDLPGDVRVELLTRIGLLREKGLRLRDLRSIRSKVPNPRA